MLEFGVLLVGVGVFGAAVFHGFHVFANRPRSLWREPNWGKVAERVETPEQVQALLRTQYPDSGDDWTFVLGEDE